jgi:hypothetical protein
MSLSVKFMDSSCALLYCGVHYIYMKPDPKLLIGGVILILLILGGVLWYMASNPAPEIGEFPEVPQGPSVGQSERISENGQYHEVSAEYPATTPLRASAGAEADAAAVEAFRTFERNTIENFKTQSGLSSLTQEDIAMFGLGGERKYALGIEYDMYQSAATVSYVFMIYEDTLGAHPNGYYRTFTFDLATGAGLQLSQLFAPGVDYLTILSQRSREALYAQLGQSAIPDMLEPGTTPDEDNFQNFYLEGDALVIIFAPYQVGPWAIGTQEVRFPTASLTGLLKAEYD